MCYFHASFFGIWGYAQEIMFVFKLWTLNYFIVWEGNIQLKTKVLPVNSTFLCNPHFFFSFSNISLSVLRLWHIFTFIATSQFWFYIYSQCLVYLLMPHGQLSKNFYICFLWLYGISEHSFVLFFQVIFPLSIFGFTLLSA